MPPALELLFTCEHAGNRVPRQFKSLFAAQPEALVTHRGYDPGAGPLADFLAETFHTPLLRCETTRLLIEPNRSLHHRRLFSQFSAGLDRSIKQQLIDTYYLPHRDAVEQHIAKRTAKAVLVHVSVHTFTPILDDVTRTADIGLLYDPRRPLERAFCQVWQKQLRYADPEWRVRLNYPYLGKADGFTTYLRKQFSADRYAGIELEVNQKWWPGRVNKAWQKLCGRIAMSLQQSRAEMQKSF